MEVKAINLHTKEEHNLDITVGMTGEEDYINIYNNTENGLSRVSEYANVEELDANWVIISKPVIYEDHTGKSNYPALNEKYMELYQHVLSRFRERALLKIGL